MSSINKTIVKARVRVRKVAENSRFLFHVRKQSKQTQNRTNIRTYDGKKGVLRLKTNETVPVSELVRIGSLDAMFCVN